MCCINIQDDQVISKEHKNSFWTRSKWLLEQDTKWKIRKQDKWVVTLLPNVAADWLLATWVVHGHCVLCDPIDSWTFPIWPSTCASFSFQKTLSRVVLNVNTCYMKKTPHFVSFDQATYGETQWASDVYSPLPCHSQFLLIYHISPQWSVFQAKVS